MHAQRGPPCIRDGQARRRARGHSNGAAAAGAGAGAGTATAASRLDEKVGGLPALPERMAGTAFGRVRARSGMNLSARAAAPAGGGFGGCKPHGGPQGLALPPAS